MITTYSDNRDNCLLRARSRASCCHATFLRVCFPSRFDFFWEIVLHKTIFPGFCRAFVTFETFLRKTRQTSVVASPG